MTILEVAESYGTKVVRSSVNDNLQALVDRIYKSRNDLYFMILMTLNNRFDWDCIEPRAQIRYIPKSYCSEIYEITSKRE